MSEGRPIIEIMKDTVLCWIVKNMPQISEEIRRGTVEIFEGRIYIWIDLADGPKVITDHNAALIGEYWVSLCNHFQVSADIFIQTNN